MVSVIKAHMNMINVTKNDVDVSYLPLAHIGERLLIALAKILAMAAGIKICIYSGDMMKLKNDFKVFRPTLFSSVLRLYNKIYDSVISALKEKRKAVLWLFNKGLETKINRLRRTGCYTHWFYDNFVFRKVRQSLGGNIRFMGSWSAPMSIEVLEFFKFVFGCPLFEDYGQTESSGEEFVISENDLLSGHVGCPLNTFEFKLVYIPEMNYTSKDTDENGNSAPRGEIWVRGPAVISGYHNHMIEILKHSRMMVD